MDIQGIRDAKNTQPFQPFTLALADGRRIEVRHPDFMALSPTGRHVFVYNSDGSWAVVEPLLIVSIEYGVPTTSNGPTASPSA
jgi:hypothetical protein